MSRRKVHLDATKPGNTHSVSACGWPYVDTETDLSKVTCVLCLKTVAKREAKPEKTLVTRAEMTIGLAEAYAQTLAPKADAPPRLTAPLWANTCKGGEHRRCGDCDICRWEREAERWEYAAPDRHISTPPKRREGAPRWPSLAAALVALADWERHDRHAKSASAGILARIEFGAIDGGIVRTGDPLLDAAGELVLVRTVLEHACPEGAHAVLSRSQCMALVLARTPGVEPVVPSYEALAERLTATVGALKALVRSVRQRMNEELAERGLIPVPRVPIRRERGSGCLTPASRF